MRERLEGFIRDHGLKHWSFAARKDVEFLSWVSEKTKNLPEDTLFSARVWAAVYDDGPVCRNGKTRQLNSIENGWRFCAKGKSCLCANESRSKKAKSIWDGKSDIEIQDIVGTRQRTLIDKYGVDNPGKLPKAKEAHAAFYADEAKVAGAVAAGRTTMMNTYGVENAFQLPHLDRKKIAQRHLSAEAAEILNNGTLFREFIESKSVATVTEELGINATTFYNYVRQYGIPNNFGSSFEKEIAAFLEQSGIRFKPRDRTVIKPLELDFWISDFNLGIEFNGLYFHSSNVVTDRFHRTKWEACRAAGIRLLMINEDEYVERPDVIRKKILNLCGKSDRGPGGRSMTVSRISISDATAFCEKYHIQGAPSAVVDAFGAFVSGELGGVVTLSRQRGTGHLDLTRFCSDGKVYPGMFSKIMKEISGHVSENIITFADLRYSDGGLYEKTGFELVGEIPPDYKYVYRNKTYHKSLFTKKRIEQKFGIDMANKTERIAMEELGYSRIYDCGKLKFIWRR